MPLEPVLVILTAQLAALDELCPPSNEISLPSSIIITLISH